MRAVNLLPYESRPGRGFSTGVDPLVVGGAVLTAVVAIAIGGGFFIEHSHASSAERQLDVARVQLAQYTASHKAQEGTPIVQTPAVASQVPTWQSAVVTALSTRVAYDTILVQVGRLVPANVSLTTVTLGATIGSVGPSAAGLTIDGTAFDENGVAQLLARLTLIPQVTGVTLSSSSADPKSGVVTFAIACQLKGASTGFTTTGGASTTSTTSTTAGSGT